MPKNISFSKTPTGAVIRHRPSPKFRIGTRKGGKAASLMTNDELKGVINDKNRKRYHSNAATVLTNRGVEVVWPKKLVAESLASVADDLKTEGG